MMRLFVAIDFPPAIRKQLAEIAGVVKKNSTQGSFTLEENIHLTLAFIGETERFDTARRVIEQIPVPLFDLTLEGLGVFKHHDGGILWVGVRKDAPLIDLQSRVYSVLADAGFNIDPRSYMPHLTLARRTIFQKDFDLEAFSKSLPPITIPVARISLMKSERIDGKLTYTEMASNRPA
ncbi:RNA 2',3'-cyclic phosphodiesterase [Methanosarcinaceae archaeon Ag5]|uniref:RNA 2',3'-cyclic phosphodiesterase n=1 Tax=Methanolapillus africanus TaxID=3028297 RepID=A0AAE4MKJ5_9EURY|nr:RNA 2',3'-cyclic phosphodiesterase [Methanosarcinaceae archaeon Ag5]